MAQFSVKIMRLTGSVLGENQHRVPFVTCKALGELFALAVLCLRYPRSGFMHIDLGPARTWGEPFPVRATPFVPEVGPAREVLADSRTLKGSGAAGIATVGAAGVEVAQDVLAEAQSAILPLVPYLDTLRWVFIAVALIGIAVAIHARIDDWKRGQR
jgi:zinc D-Ala-D-Ala carboxypeptidase